jgi:DNA-directed RNA polymerase subunit RPC12/RpoP
VFVPWFFLAVWHWFSSHLHRIRQQRLSPKQRLGLLLWVSPTLVWIGLVGDDSLGPLWTAVLLVLVGLALLALLALVNRIATETAYACPGCGAERMRLAGPVSADPHSSASVEAYFRCRVCESRWRQTPQGWCKSGTSRAPVVVE